MVGVAVGAGEVEEDNFHNALVRLSWRKGLGT